MNPLPPPSTTPSPTSEEDEGSIGIEILIETDDEFIAEVDAGDLTSAIRAALLAEGREGEVTLVVTTDEAVAELNQQYREVTGPTDVLSFPAQEPTPGFVSAPEMDAYLGDVIIALPFTRRQAASLDHPLRDELRLLAVHGVLHLLGYDHADPDEEAVMWSRQEAILAQLS